MKVPTILCSSTSQIRPSIVSFILRLAVAGAMLSHGIPKLMSFTTLSQTFPDPIGLGSTLSLLLVIGAEVFCSLLLLLGFLTRLTVLPLIFNMLVVFFVVHQGLPFSGKELPFFYLIIYIAIFILGGGFYSLDKMFFRKMPKEY